MPFWMILQPVNPADTFFEIAVEALVGKLSAVAARALLGSPAEQALREVFAAAIETVVSQVAARPDAASAGPDALSRWKRPCRLSARSWLRRGGSRTCPAW